MIQSNSRHILIDILKQLGVAAAYVILAQLALTYSVSGFVTLLWPASGMALAAILLGGRRYALGIYCGALIAYILAEKPLGLALTLATGNTLEALAGSWLLTRKGEFSPARQRLRDYFKMILIAGGISCPISALTGNVALLMSGIITGTTFLSSLINWWRGDLLGIILITPLVLIWAKPPPELNREKWLGDALVLFTLSCLAGQIAFFDWLNEGISPVINPYLIFACVTWIAFRLGPWGTVSAITLAGIQGLLSVYLGTGFLHEGNMATQMSNYWYFMLMLSVFGMALASFILERKQAELKLGELNEHLTMLVEAIPDAVLFKDGQGRWLTTNEPAKKLFKLHDMDWYGKTDSELVRAKLQSKPVFDSCFAGDARAWEAKKLIVMNETIVDEHGGAHYFEVRKVPLFNPDETRRAMVIIGSDITERKLTETESEKLKDQLLQAQKMESIGRLAGGVAHDFNNLLMGIMGYTALCTERIPKDHPIRPWLNEIMSGAKRSADLTRQLLAFARKQTIAPITMNLNESISGISNMLRRLIGEDIELILNPGDELWPILMDPSQIDQILANLTINARDAIAGTGKLTISTRNAMIDESLPAVNADIEPGDYVVLTVSDTGSGIDASTLPHIFEPFFTTKEIGKGTGLGLSTLYGIVKQNNCFVSVESTPGQGATFNLYFPRSTDTTDVVVSDTKSEGIPTGNESILLVEDEDSVRLLTQEFLESLGYQVIAANAPEQALEIAQGHASINLLITDVIMPGMSGRDLVTKLTAIRPGLECLYISGYTSDYIASRGVLEKDVQLLEKPFTRKAISLKVREILDAKINSSG